MKGAQVKTAFKVVDASFLVISNNQDGTITPEERRSMMAKQKAEREEESKRVPCKPPITHSRPT